MAAVLERTAQHLRVRRAARRSDSRTPGLLDRKASGGGEEHLSATSLDYDEAEVLLATRVVESFRRYLS